MTKNDISDDVDNATLVNKGKTPILSKSDEKGSLSNEEDDDEEDSDDEDLLNRVNAKLNTLKSDIKAGLDDDDVSDDASEKFIDTDKTPMTKESYVGDGIDNKNYNTNGTSQQEQQHQQHQQHQQSQTDFSISQEKEIRNDTYDDDMQEINLDEKQTMRSTESTDNIPLDTPGTSSFSLNSKKIKEPSSETSSIAPKKPVSAISSWFNRRKSVTSVSSRQSKNSFAFQTDQGDIISFKLLATRAEKNIEDLKSLPSTKEQEQIKSGADTLKNLFSEFKTNVESHGDQDAKSNDYIDWDFWATTVNDYHGVVKNDPIRLYAELTNGIPAKLRGLVWQLILNSKSFGLEEFYTTMVLENSNHEKQIKKDLSRTRFVSEASMLDKGDGLYNIIKAYSLYDTEVGYTQGMAFITVPLLMNMNESEAFCALVKLMKNYNLREFYLPDMPGLHLVLYQFERLLEDLCPKLHTHLVRQGVKSSMYASQWFLTMFAYKFPLEIVIRIFDVIVAEGIEASLKFAVALMQKNEEKLLTFNFDQLLDYLKDRLFDYYLVDDKDNKSLGEETTSLNPFAFMTSGGISNKVAATDSYRVDELVQDAMKIKILPLTLKKYESEYQEIHRLEKEREEEVESLRTKNAQLTREIRKLEQSYAVLNKEHVEVANEMIQGKVNLANLEDENSDLKQEISHLEEKIKLLEVEQQEKLEEIEAKGDSMEEIPLDKVKNNDVNIEEEIRRTMERNLEVMEANRFLEEQLNTLENQFKDSRKELDTVKKEHENLRKKWNVAKSFFSD